MGKKKCLIIIICNCMSILGAVDFVAPYHKNSYVRYTDMIFTVRQSLCFIIKSYVNIIN